MDKRSPSTTVCDCPALAGHTMKVLGFAWVQPIDIDTVLQIGSGYNIEDGTVVKGPSAVGGRI